MSPSHHIQSPTLSLALSANGALVAITAHGCRYPAHPGFRPVLVHAQGQVFFDEATQIEVTKKQTGLGPRLIVRFSGFEVPGLSFETLYDIDLTTEDLSFTFVPLDMAGLTVTHVAFPAPLVVDGANSRALIPLLQGMMIDRDAEGEAPKLPFDGHMSSCSAYLSCFGEVADAGGYLSIVHKPWDTKYTVVHRPGDTQLYVRHLPSLGLLTDSRTVTTRFFPAGADHVTLMHHYRQHAIDTGLFVSLAEKAARCEKVHRLIGSSVLHVPTKTHLSPDSTYYNKEDPSKNDSLRPFKDNENIVQKLRARGMGRMYLHLDGWGAPGYDNQHPDYLPPVPEAGGWEGLKSLVDTLQEGGDLFGFHDQYRDYYLDAPTYDPDDAAMSADGSLFELTRWAGGKQNYLCASLAPAYVRRNFTEILSQGIRPDCTYLDVFTCNEPDECINPRHTMTRRECLDYRRQCFDYLLSEGILPSSEEVADWAMPSLVFCHWAPYANGFTPLPLFNLVYHDAVLIPWMLGYGEWGTPAGEWGFLHALLNGGMGYVDGDLDGEELDENIKLCKVVSDWQELVAFKPMVSHRFLTEDRTVQEAVFEGGHAVTVDFKNKTYALRKGNK